MSRNSPNEGRIPQPLQEGPLVFTGHLANVSSKQFTSLWFLAGSDRILYQESSAATSASPELAWGTHCHRLGQLLGTQRA